MSGGVIPLGSEDATYVIVPTCTLDGSTRRYTSRASSRRRGSTNGKLPILLLRRRRRTRNRDRESRLKRSTVRGTLSGSKTITILSSNDGNNTTMIKDRDASSRSTRRKDHANRLLHINDRSISDLNTRVMEPMRRRRTTCRLRSVGSGRRRSKTDRQAISNRIQNSAYNSKGRDRPRSDVTSTTRETRDNSARNASNISIDLLLLRERSSTRSRNSRRQIDIRRLRIILRKRLRIILIIYISLLRAKRSTMRPTNNLRALMIRKYLRIRKAGRRLIRHDLVRELHKDRVIMVDYVEYRLHHHLRSRRGRGRRPT